MILVTTPTSLVLNSVNRVAGPAAAGPVRFPLIYNRTVDTKHRFWYNLLEVIEMFWNWFKVGFAVAFGAGMALLLLTFIPALFIACAGG